MKTKQTSAGTPSNEPSRQSTRRAALRGDSQAQLALGKIYRDGTTVRRCYKTALRWLLKASPEQAEAGYLAGWLFNNGHGIERDEKKAFQCFLESAERGYPPAMTAVSSAYYGGDGVRRDDRKAFEWAKRAHEAGEINATAGLGLMYSEGCGVRKDARKGLALLMQAADNGHAAAQLDVGARLAEGRGVAADKTKALHYLKLAALSDDMVDGIQPLEMIWRICLAEGNTQEALKWLNVGAHDGCLEAWEKLAEIYRDGIGVEPDPVLAGYWERRVKEW